MSYLHIDNLYKDQTILMFKEVYALEKIHGSSAHVSWKDGVVNFFAGGTDHASFVNLFDAFCLPSKFQEIFMGHPHVIVYGEAYGGKCQGMKETYGPDLRFVAFDVKVDDSWLNVPNAEAVARKLGLDFVHYVKVSTDLENLDAQRDAVSVQMGKNGIMGAKPREGIVLRPLIELIKNNGERIICKHKGDAFQETKTKREVDPDKAIILAEAEAIADEWVTPMRLTHVLQGFKEIDITITGDVIKAMLEDVTREAKGEIVESKDAMRAIGKKTAILFKQHLGVVKCPIV